MEIKSGDLRDELKFLLEDYKITPYTFGLISGLDEKTVLELAIVHYHYSYNFA